MFSDYRRLIEKVDSHCRTLADSQAAHLVCAPGCDGCCRQRLRLAPVEVFHIADWLTTRPEAQRLAVRRHLEDAARNGDDDLCPLLSDGQCRVYPVRPLVCRSHGFLLLLSQGDEPPGLVRSCELNHTATSPEAIGTAGAINQSLLSALMFQVDGLFARTQRTHHHGERWELLRLLDITGW